MAPGGFDHFVDLVKLDGELSLFFGLVDVGIDDG